ncbi:sugar phosphate nucleotidyltransferase, partial [Candidatus Latescibacterota bacterium]
MIVIIPVAGSGTRLRPLTHSKPKALLNVGSKPIIAHIIDSLLPLGCTKLVLIISHEGNNIPLYVRKHYPDIETEVVIQEKQLGLGHAVSLTKDFTNGEDVVVMYGDTIIDGNFSEFIDPRFDGVIAVKEVDDPRRFGVVNVVDNVITQFVEKPSEPESNLAIVGFNYFKSSPQLFECLENIIEKNMKTKGEFQITDAFQLMVERGARLKPFTIEGWFDCGTPETLLETNRYMLAKEGSSRNLPGSIVIPPVFIPEDVHIEHSIIGPNVSIGTGAVIKKSIISDSIIGCGAQVANACINGSLIGDNAHVIERSRVLAIGDNSS